jgi:uncharacterized Zn finger protein
MRRRREHDRRPRFFPPSQPRAVEGGIKAQSRAGSFGQNWWAKRWQAVLESFHVGARLARGRNYARSGQVVSIDIEKGKVKARVQGSRPNPYQVSIEIKVLNDKQWRHLLDVLSGQALFVAKLLAGEMPEDIEGVFREARLSLFPDKRGDLRTDCSCPDSANPCKHIAAVYYLLGEEFDRDPFLLFRLRGLEREELLERLGRTQVEAPGRVEAVEEAPVVGEALPTKPVAYWSMGELPEDLYGAVQQPPVSGGWVRRLGKFPFWRGEKPLTDSLETVYVRVGEEGLKVFLGEKG